MYSRQMAIYRFPVLQHIISRDLVFKKVLNEEIFATHCGVEALLGAMWTGRDGWAKDLF